MTTVGTIWVCGDDYPDRVCDCCEKRMNGLQHFNWKEKDFALCFNCIEELYKEAFNADVTHEQERYKKASIPSDVRWRIWKRDKFICQYCGIDEDLSIDHIIPESRGGGLIDSNLVSACKKCNSKKNGRTPEEAGMELIADPREDR